MEEVRLLHFRAHVAEVLGGIFQNLSSFARLARNTEVGRLLARVTPGAIFCEHHLALIKDVCVVCQEGRTVLRIGEPVWLGRLQEEKRQVGRLLGGGLPVNRVFLRVTDLNRRDALPAHEGSEMAKPFLAVQSNIDEDTVERAGNSDEFRTVLENMCR